MLYTVRYCLPVTARWMSPEPGPSLAYIVGGTEQVMTARNIPIPTERVDSEEKYHFPLVLRGVLMYVCVSREYSDLAV